MHFLIILEISLTPAVWIVPLVATLRRTMPKQTAGYQGMFRGWATENL